MQRLNKILTFDSDAYENAVCNLQAILLYLWSAEGSG